MKVEGSIFANCFLSLAVFLLSGLATGHAQTSEEIYSTAVRQLQAEGYAGIDKALPVFEELIRKDPNFLKGYVSAADAYLLKYEFSEQKNKVWLNTALDYLNKAVSREGQNPVLYFKRAVIHFNLEQPEKAAGDLRKALELDPKYLDARLLHLQYLLSLRKTEEARKFVEASLPLFPKDPAPLKYIADVVFNGGDYEKAVELYQQVIALVPKAPNTHLALGKAYLNLKKYPLAIASFQKALSQEPELTDTHFSLAVAYSETGNLKEAVAQLETYLQKVPKDASALNNLALLYEQTGETTKARITWLKLKEASADKAYKERAEQHLHGLSSRGNKQADPSTPPTAAPAQGGKK
jgi:tetratricopeptide (TPR) repeat protein